jgi:hypothetical protein
MFPEHLVELNNQKIQKDRLFILKEEMIKPKSEVTHFLNALGSWMIVKGEKLHKRYSAKTRISKLALLQDESIIFKS